MSMSAAPSQLSPEHWLPGNSQPVWLAWSSQPASDWMALDSQHALGWRTGNARSQPSFPMPKPAPDWRTGNFSSLESEPSFSGSTVNAQLVCLGRRETLQPLFDNPDPSSPERAGHSQPPWEWLTVVSNTSWLSEILGCFRLVIFRMHSRTWMEAWKYKNDK